MAICSRWPYHSPSLPYRQYSSLLSYIFPTIHSFSSIQSLIHRSCDSPLFPHSSSLHFNLFISGLVLCKTSESILQTLNNTTGTLTYLLTQRDPESKQGDILFINRVYLLFLGCQDFISKDSNTVNKENCKSPAPCINPNVFTVPGTSPHSGSIENIN